MSRNNWIAASAFALIVFAAGAGVTIAQQAPIGAPAWVGALATAQLVEVRDTSGNVLVHGTLTTKENTANETEREADLASPSGQASKGEIAVELERKDGAVIEGEIEVEVEKLGAMLDCEVFLDGRSIGTFVTSKKGKGELELEWKAVQKR